ncbi:holin [Bacillus sp. 2205SS5-2]|uniref:holin n=1 Tax=Bacillus sp. 2205SS5-2 TaxID=3109031 RepID=UPI00300589EF
MERLKNYVLWTAVASLGGLALIDLNLVDSLDKYEVYVDKILYILVLLGVINNPSLGKGLKDKGGE